MPCMIPMRRGALAAACAFAVLPATAQVQPVTTSATTSTTTIVVTGNPLGRDAPVQPSSVLAGEALAQRRAGTLGETLDGLPGVAATGFGPNASRPVIRGLDGDRVRLLDNGGGTVDASNLSFDHAVAIDPLAVERVEVLRGPAALLYGGNATGGVVNTIDNRIPRVPAAGFGGRAELRLGGAARERGGAAVLEGGAGGLAWHADAFTRRTDDQRVPRYTPVEDGAALEPATRVRNSASDARGGAVGAGWVVRDGFAGAAVDTWRNDYGVTAEPDVTIRMKRDRLALAGEARALAGPFEQLAFQASHTRYEHAEVEGDGAIGTTFRSRGQELRVQARHAPLGVLGGVVGVQVDALDFSALGEEAFVPATRTRGGALFVLEEAQLGALVLSAGLRAERVRVRSEGDTPEAAEPRFGSAGERRFAPLSASFGAAHDLGSGWRATASLGHTERAPAYYELYANGLHLATGAFEVGDPTLGTERSRHVEAGVAWQAGASSLALNLFQTRFARYIALDASGASVDVDGSPVPEYRFGGVRARLRGAELDGRWRAVERPWVLDLTGGLDLVRGDNLDRAEPLPRLAPLRLRAGAELAADGWRAGAGLRHAARQDRVPAGDSSTAGWTMLDLWGARTFALGADREAQLMLRLANATDRLAYNAGTVATLRGLAPLPGRALSMSLRVAI